MWHWRAKWDLSGVIWSPVVGGVYNYLGTESQQRQPIWLVNYPWNSREVRGWPGWQSPLSLLDRGQFQSTLTSYFSSGGGHGCLGCGYPAEQAPRFLRGGWFRESEAQVLSLPFPLPSCVTLRKASSVSVPQSSSLKTKSSSKMMLGRAFLCQHSLTINLEKQKQHIINHRFRNYLLKICQEIKLTIC